MVTKHVVVERYSETWPRNFISIRNEIKDALRDLVLRIEHVGSTSVPGLSAKPIIDIDVVIRDCSVFDAVVTKLGAIGYQYEGDLGIAGREAFRYDGKAHLQKHHLYVCTQDSAELKRHVAFRDYLRSHPDAVREYSRIKEEGAARYPYDIEKYIGYKSPFIERIYRKAGISNGNGGKKAMAAEKEKASPECNGTAEWIIDDGIRLSAVLEKPADSDGRRIVILLHGFTSAKDRPHTIRAAEAMREAGYATLRFDLYGHGESGGEFRKHTLYKWISNTITVIDYVRGLGYTEIYLSGHSQGGLVAALAAGMEAERISGLILRAPAFMIPQCARDGNMLGRVFDPDHIPDEVPVIKGLTLEGNYVRVAQTIHVEDAADRYKGPVLILHGDEDDTVPLAESQKTARRYSDCTVVVMKGETHHFDRHPEEMKEMIRGWLKERTCPAGAGQRGKA